METEKIQRLPLKDQIRDILIERIVDGRLQPGDRLKELELARELGTSQAPVREALRGLEALGYIEHRPHAGARVRQVDRAEVIECYQVREALETYAIGHAQKALIPYIKKMEKALTQMKRAAKKKSVSAYAQHDVIFHRLFVEAAGNQTLLKVWDSLLVQSRVATALFMTQADLQEAVDLHPPIVQALKDQAWKEAAEQMRLHYQAVQQYW